VNGARPEAGGRVEDGDLSGFDWTDADLVNASFDDCLITDDQLSGVNLTGARFRRCRILRCRFAHADLREASFEDCVFADPDTSAGLSVVFSNLEQARFERCDLTLSLFDRSSLYAVEMAGCNLRGARFDKADFAKSFGGNVVRTVAAFRDCNFELADLSEARLAGCALTGCDLRDADLRGEPITAVLDSGSQVTIGNPALRRLADAHDPDAVWSAATIESASGQSIPARVTSLRDLGVSGLVIQGLSVAFADLHAFRLWGLGGRPAILLGVDVLSRFDAVELDFAKGEVRFRLPASA
jgi:uncharacterized protein YjbI with pentapeptide repeats